MCAIIGIASQYPIINRAWLETGREAMHHRGPDDAGEWCAPDGRVVLGHRRLSIIDLSPAGKQPMQDFAGELRIVLNGEIYNFRELRAQLEEIGTVFTSHSDTEVIVAAYREWGTDCLSRLNGMFAFALYDSRRERLFLARDRAGEKPLFYSHEKQTFRFASELKALMADPAYPRQINPQALDCYLAQGYVPGDLCILQSAKKLPAAHALLFDLNSGQCRTWRYWQLPAWDHGDRPGNPNDDDLIDELERLLESAVRRQLVADVPVGVLLSGGVDSSLVTAMAVRAKPNVRTFTIRVPGHGMYDETEHARLIARHFCTDHVELEAEAATVDLLPRLARQFDEPVIDSSMIPMYLVSRLARQYCTVALGGDGGDELFGGYGHYNRLLWLQRRVGSVPRWVRRIVAVGGCLALPTGFKGRNWLHAAGTDFNNAVPLVASYYDDGMRRRLIGTRSSCVGAAEHIHDARTPDVCDLLQRATRMDFENYLPDDILVKVDRASMLNSLEVRAPLLDYHLIEFAFGRVPSHLRATANSRKVLLKRLAGRILPRAFDTQRKQGFSIPLGAWLRSGSWRQFFSDVLLDSASIFDHGTVRALLKGEDRGRSNSERLFGLVLFELWRRNYSVSF